MISNPDLAAKITASMLATSRRLNESLLDARERCSDEEFQWYRRAVGKILGEMLLEVLNPIWADHPELMGREMQPADGPRVYLELHDSTLQEVETCRGWLHLYLYPAFVHVWRREEGGWRGQGWSRDVLLSVADGEVSSGGSSALPSDVSEGQLSIGAERLDNILSLPYGETGETHLRLRLTNGDSIEVRGAGVSLFATNHGSLVNAELPDDFAPFARSSRT